MQLFFYVLHHPWFVGSNGGEGRHVVSLVNSELTPGSKIGNPDGGYPADICRTDRHGGSQFLSGPYWLVILLFFIYLFI